MEIELVQTDLSCVSTEEGMLEFVSLYKGSFGFNAEDGLAGSDPPKR
jgi:hypothetical protein